MKAQLHAAWTTLVLYLEVYVRAWIAAQRLRYAAEFRRS